MEWTKFDYSKLAAQIFPGDYYLAVLKNIHDSLKPETYLEIGIETGQSLELANKDTLSIGIDPIMSLFRRLPSRVKLFPMESDEFFDRFDLSKELEGRPLDLAFIDGSHLFEQALRDFINIERYANEKTVVIFHDIMPIDQIVANRERRSIFWCGDVWKVMPLFRKYRPNLKFCLVPVNPSGLMIVKNLNIKKWKIEYYSINRIIDIKYNKLPYFSLYDHIGELDKLFPELIPNDFEQIINFVLTK